MKNDYGNAALELAAINSDKILATVDATAERALSERFNIRG